MERGMTDSKRLDAQSGYESALTVTIVALSGSNLIHDSVGLLEMCQVFSYDKTVIDNEILGNVLRLMKGVEVNEETLVLELIRSVGQGGHFVDADHTVWHFRKEFFIPKPVDPALKKSLRATFPAIKGEEVY